MKKKLTNHNRAAMRLEVMYQLRRVTLQLCSGVSKYYPRLNTKESLQTKHDLSGANPLPRPYECGWFITNVHKTLLNLSMCWYIGCVVTLISTTKQKIM